ncbi:class I SAM-dependent methyltransferase [Mesorhizobium sp. WSM4303]|uniref:class I SAM-dependent methyltransferase n=1 Tax=unclassified Mesorhizobium TaxID=325217 RepID=UPI00115D2D74|nr:MULTISPECIES: class I SAM-dependent methyltransferase [unclassified Mesorhizobium]TRC94343.1 class I SAM-dependent methyltransferase [Mesorhizobium sp. WSM4306]TRD07324.1 class I SAM-dependent methyltransferase [Mesorhizobium sp. WSM4303]
MAAEPLKTLFHPFEAEALPPPQKGERVLFLGAEPGFRLPEGFEATLHLVQGFRPHFRALERAGHTVTPRPEGDAFDAALVLVGRHRGQNEMRIAEAIARVTPGGLIVVAGGKEDGIDSLRKRIDELVPLEGHLPKHHGIAFWLRRPVDLVAAEKLRAANPVALIDRRFRTAPGMFSFDRIDAGSKLLVDNLPKDLGGKIADFCAGWGYVAAEVAASSPGITGLDLYEAGFDALEAAKGNIGVTSFEPGFFWIDLLSEPVERRYDVIVMNPPFHRSRAAEPEIGAGMIQAAGKALKPGGRLFMVANRQLPYEPVLKAVFSSHSELARDGMFKVFAARR